MERKTNEKSVEGGVVKESTTDQNPVKVEDNGKENTGTSDEMAIVTESSKNDFSNGSSVALDNRTSFYKNNNKNFSYNARNGERKFYNKNYSNRDGSSGGEGSENLRYNRFRRRRKICEFCAENLDFIDYKDTSRLSKFLTDRAKIITRRSAGTCARHQRELATALKRARYMALLPCCNR